MRARSNGLTSALAAATFALTPPGAARESQAYDPGSAPQPRFDRNPLYPAQVTLYGRLDLGLVQATAAELQPVSPCATATIATASDRPALAVGGLSRSFVGLRGDEKLSGPWSAHLRLEHSLRPDTGGFDDACGRFWDARSTVGLSHREWGRVDFGRRDQPAWLVALRGDPWAGNTVASPRRRLYAAPVAGSTRSSGALTYSSRTDRPWAFELQAASAEAAGERGASVRYEWGAWYAGAGWQRWADGDWAVPLAVVYDTGRAKWMAAATSGTAAGGSYQTGFVGLTLPMMGKGDPYRHEWRVGLSRYNAAAEQADWKLGVGWRYRFSKRTSVQWNAAVVRRDGKGSRGAVDVGISHHFERDLRYPQSPD